jgi:hypothetical protein
MVGTGGRAQRGLQHPSIMQSTSGRQNLNLFLLFVVTKLLQKLLQKCKSPAVTKTEQTVFLFWMSSHCGRRLNDDGKDNRQQGFERNRLVLNNYVDQAHN